MHSVISEITSSLIATLMGFFPPNVGHIITCSPVRPYVLTAALKVDTTTTKKKNEFMPLQAEIGSSGKYHPKMSLAKCQLGVVRHGRELASGELSNTCPDSLLPGRIKTSICSVYVFGDCRQKNGHSTRLDTGRSV